MNPLDDYDLEKIEQSAHIKRFVHTQDALRLVEEIRRLRQHNPDRHEQGKAMNGE